MRATKLPEHELEYCLGLLDGSSAGSSDGRPRVQALWKRGRLAAELLLGPVDLPLGIIASTVRDQN